MKLSNFGLRQTLGKRHHGSRPGQWVQQYILAVQKTQRATAHEMKACDESEHFLIHFLSLQKTASVRQRCLEMRRLNRAFRGPARPSSGRIGPPAFPPPQTLTLEAIGRRLPEACLQRLLFPSARQCPPNLKILAGAKVCFQFWCTSAGER